MIAPTAIIQGMGKTLDMDIIEVEGATGDYHTNLDNKASIVLILESCLEHIQKDYNFGFLHIKAVDECGHDKNLKLREEFMIKIDKMIGYIYENLKKLDDNYIICVTGDHTTPCHIGDHTYQSVPIMITPI